MITIGVTGHRASRLGGIDIAVLADAVDRTLGRVAAAVGALASPVQLRLITALADGADTIVAECAVAHGWLLASVLPFPHEAYLADFVTPRGRAAYRRLLVTSHEVFELPGVHREGESPNAYENAGRFVLNQSDILLALWDGGPAQGRGGTAQIVAEAMAQDIPVILIDPCGGSAPSLLWSGRPDAPRGSLDALPRLIRELPSREI